MFIAVSLMEVEWAVRICKITPERAADVAMPASV